MIQLRDRPLILFDGICNLCNSSVRFILHRDKQEQFLFSSLQSDAAKEILLHYKYKNNQLESLVLVDQGRIYIKSQAVSRICRLLGYPWRTLDLLNKLVPRSWADAIYDYVAKNRYRWFGKKDHCTVEIRNHENRFI